MRLAITTSGQVYTANMDVLDKKNVRQLHAEHFLRDHIALRHCDEFTDIQLFTIKIIATNAYISIVIAVFYIFLGE